MGLGLASFIAGAGSGYMGAQRQSELDGERKADRAMRKEEFDAKMEEVNAAKGLRLSLADAARPASTIDGTAVTDGSGNRSLYKTAPDAAALDSMQAESDMRAEQAGKPATPLSLASARGLSAGKGASRIYTDGAEADKAMAGYNTPESVAQRQGQALRLAGKPVEALDLEQKQAAITDKQREYAKRLKDENVSGAMRAFRSGDAKQMATIFNATGEFKLDGDPVMTQEERDIGGRKIPTYNAKVRLVGPDGKVKEQTFNSYDLSMQMLPWEKYLDAETKMADTTSKISKREGDVDNALKRIELTGQLGEARLAAQQVKGDGNIGREERLRYTSLFQDAGRRVGEAQKTLSTLTSGPNSMMFSMAVKRDPNGPEAQQLAELRSTIKTHSDERSMYQGLLAGSQGGGSPAANSPSVKPAAGTQATRDGGRLEILNAELATAQQRLASGDTRAQGDIDALQREIGGTRAPSLADARPAGAAKTSAVPAAVKTKAERDALPKGTRYTDPSGNTFIKQ